MFCFCNCLYCFLHILKPITRNYGTVVTMFAFLGVFLIEDTTCRSLYKILPPAQILYAMDLTLQKNRKSLRWHVTITLQRKEKKRNKKYLVLFFLFPILEFRFFSRSARCDVNRQKKEKKKKNPQNRNKKINNNK